MTVSYDNPWLYSGVPFDSEHISDYIGFIYCITEISTGKLYVGKKIFRNKKAKPPLKGKKNRRITWVESDWKSYYGSNGTLKQLVADNGGSLYKREIIHLCKSKAHLNYMETKELFDRNVLFDGNYFNDWVTCKITRGQLQNVENGL